MRTIITMALFLALATVAGCDRGLDHEAPPGTLGEQPAAYGATGKVSFVGPSNTAFSFKDPPVTTDTIENQDTTP